MTSSYTNCDLALCMSYLNMKSSFSTFEDDVNRSSTSIQVSNLNPTHQSKNMAHLTREEVIKSGEVSPIYRKVHLTSVPCRIITPYNDLKF